jgi:hypothetical protein
MSGNALDGAEHGLARRRIVKHSALVFSFFAFTVWTADEAQGQAMVGYGINVGRAGAAGAAAGATGAGAAGIFGNLNSRLSEQPKTQSGARTAQPEFDSEQLKESREHSQAPSFSTSGTTVETSSGVKISGRRSTPPPVMPTRYQARSLDYEPAPYTPTASSAPVATPPIAAQPKPLSKAPQGEPEQTPEAEKTAEADAAALPTAEIQGAPRQAAAQPVYVLDGRTTVPDQAAPAQETEAEVTPSLRQLFEIDSEIADIPEGTSIQAVIERFGAPIFKMVGLPGQDYSEKYIFRMADGRRFTVFTQDGMVANILVEPLVLGNRAAL